MANLTGLFAGLNNAINTNPLLEMDDQTVDGMVPGAYDNMNPLLRAAAQGLGGVANSKLGTNIDTQTSRQKMQGIKSAMSKLDLKTSQGLSMAAELYGSVGMLDKQVAMASAAQQQALREDAIRKEGQTRVSLAQRARDLELPGMAETIMAGTIDMDDAAKQLRTLEVEQAAMRHGLPGRLALMRAKGLTPEDLPNWDKMDPKLFSEVMNGYNAELKPYQDASGETKVFKTMKNGGKVMDPATGGWVEAHTLGLKPPVLTQRQINMADAFAEAVQKEGAKSFTELYQDANEATATLENNYRSILLMDEGINSGPLAKLKTMAQKGAALLGFGDPSDAERSDAYIQERATEIAQVITAFGAGTGLSNEDAKRAEGIAAGNIELNESTLRWLVIKSTQAASRKIAHFNEVRDGLLNTNRKDLATPLSVLRVRQPVYKSPFDDPNFEGFGGAEEPVVPEGSKEVLSPSAAKYLQ